jgi:hypothetical protein
LLIVRCSGASRHFETMRNLGAAALGKVHSVLDR